MSRGKRPESTLPPNLYYDDKEAYKYTSNSHIIDVQTRISERAIELLTLEEGESFFLLDIGCGSGLSGEIISENGHTWIGIDISSSMLRVAKERECEGDLILGDIGEGLPFRSASFDGAISISALQWLCNADRTDHNPVKRIRDFFQSLYACLSRGARAVLQFYPECTNQVDLLQSEALKAGFSGGLLVDFPNSSKAKKYFLVLDVGTGRSTPQPLVNSESLRTINLVAQTKLDSIRDCQKQKRCPKKGVAWIKNKKESARRKMMSAALDSKYTGRKRRPKF